MISHMNQEDHSQYININVIKNHDGAVDTNLQYKLNVKYFSVKKIKQDVLNQIKDIDST